MQNGDGPDSGQFGLLDLSVDLSVPEVYSGTDFTLYLHVKNPFPSRIWIRSVELSLPTQLKWRPSAKFNETVATKKRWWRSAIASRRQIRSIKERINHLSAELGALNPDQHAREAEIRSELQALDAILRRSQLEVGSVIEAGGDSSIYIENAQTSGNVILAAEGQGRIHIERLNAGSVGPERVPLQGSLPKGASLEPGCTDVWTIRLGSARSPFFIPAQYKLQMTVIYSTTPPKPEQVGRDGRQEGMETVSEQLYSNTTASTVQVKAALWAVITGGVIGGIIGSAGRSLQDAKSFDVLFGARGGASMGALVLAVILSGAAIVFAARKSDAQAFISVEDFWGGLLVGFLIGYSGTAAFSDITGVPT